MRWCQKKLLVPCTTRWNSFYDALARICEISMVDLNTISSKLGLNNCFYGTLLPTIETLMLKTEALKSGLQILRDLPDAIVTVRT